MAKKQKISFQQAVSRRVLAERLAKQRTEQKRTAIEEYPSYNLPYGRKAQKKAIEEKEQWKSYQKQMETPVYKETISRAVRPAKEIGEYTKAGIAEKYSRIIKGESRAKVLRRARGTQAILTALGTIPTQTKAGRPKGSYNPLYAKYGGVMAYRKAMQQRKILYQQYQMQQQQRFAQKGFTPEQVQQLQQQQVIQEIQTPHQESPQRFARPAPTNVADEELAFRQFQIQQQVSPNTQRILDNIRRVQNKAKIDNMEQQRRHFERNLVGRSMNMAKAHLNMIDTTIDFAGVSSDNILLAPNIWKENENNPHILKKRRFNILNTGETGFRLKF